MAEVVVRLGDLHLDVTLAVEPGRTVAIVGPNGAGKTTLLRALAGLQPVASGRVVLDGTVLEDATDNVSVAVEDRPTGVVFQDHLLFPHLSALDNVAFGLRCQGVGRHAAEERAGAWLERVGLKEHARAKPNALSGGQAQRVALARALAIEPSMLLLDEPLAALDATTRPASRRDLSRHLAAHSGVRILVTHDPVDAAALADHIVVLEGGRVVQEGTLIELTERPRSSYVADLVGVNFLVGRSAENHVDVGPLVLTIADPTDGAVHLVIPPRAVTLSLRRPEGTARNVWPGTVDHLEPTGDRVRVRVDGPIAIVAEVTDVAVRALGLGDGTPVWVAVKATEIQVSAA